MTFLLFPYILCWDNLNPYSEWRCWARHRHDAANLAISTGEQYMPRTLVYPFSRHIIVSIAAFLILVVAAPAQVRNRIKQNIGDTESVMISARHPLARAEFDQGRVEGSLRINHASMVFKLSPAQQADLVKLLAAQQDPQSPNYRKWLTPEQYAARFGMSDSDLTQVSSWLKSQGLTVDGFSRARTQVFFSGSASQVESAFHTQFNRYLVDGQMSVANAVEISVPEAIAGMVQGFRGFENFRPQPRVHAVKPNFTSHQTGNHFVAPGDFATIYNVPAALDGTGQTIAVVGQTDINFSDIDAFRTAAGLPARTSANFQKTLITPGVTGFNDGDEVEANLDLEWTNAVAKKATIVYVYTGANSTTKNVFDSLAFAIDNNLAPVISISYGNCEAKLPGFVSILQQEAQQANSQGQTITAASGDSGAGDCEDAKASSATHGLAVDAPGSVPEVTAIGGTEFTGDAAGVVTGTAPNTIAAPTTFWSGTTTTDSLSSALRYIPETTWNDTAQSVAAGGGLSATGGGKSTVFSKPSWQVGAGVPNDAVRDVPDVSLGASPNHDPFLICSQSFFAGVTPAVNSCTAGFRASDGMSLAAVGGTSVGAPAFAGIVALLNQKTGSHGLGNINPTLYSLAASTTGVFNDILTGDNKVPCTQGSTGCPTAAPFQFGFSAGPGYDMVTGLGSVDVTNLTNAWAGLTVTPDFTLFGYSATATAPGQQATSQIVVESLAGFSGTVDLTCQPSSTSAQITCSISPTSVTVGGTGATATMTISTTAPHILPGASASLRTHGWGWLATSGGVLFGGVFLVGLPLNRRRRIAGLGVMLLVFFAAGVGCGGGSSSSSTPKNVGTAAGSYSITVTATSTSPALSHTANVSVTVQ
jgi:subtilase family serine protease